MQFILSMSSDSGNGDFGRKYKTPVSVSIYSYQGQEYNTGLHRSNVARKPPPSQKKGHKAAFMFPISHPAFVCLSTIDRGTRATTNRSGDKLPPWKIPLLILKVPQCLSSCPLVLYSFPISWPHSLLLETFTVTGRTQLTISGLRISNSVTNSPR